MLTDTKLRALKPRDAAFRVADSNGLCIEVRTTGAKVWRYRIPVCRQAKHGDHRRVPCAFTDAGSCRARQATHAAEGWS
ncbi:Arm DNA-binding domain-containing protein [Xanthomonas sp. 3075]|uniref:Arm DNA-binding domain-containing protein n=1 Tax=Xanthomonas sp. 3075 TaxID=3035315 RepID=UPI001C84F0CC|nr:Arm DNA-binding domain-containing protein [Xanthomonas sp. 3075]